MKIKNIQPSSLRGVPRNWGDVPVGRRGAIIFGGNGTGKSSIVDAVEFAITGESSLYPDNQLGVNWGLGSSHVIDGDPQVTCTVEDDAGCRHEISSRVEVPEATRDWIELARSSKFVLRRHMLLSFIIARPAERYQALSEFLDLSEYISIEEQLHNIAISIESSISDHDSGVEASEQSLRKAFDLQLTDAVNIDHLIQIAKTTAIELGLLAEDDNLDIQTIATKVKESSSDEIVSKELGHLANLRSKATRLTSVSALYPQLEAAKSVCTALEKIEYEEIQLHLVAVIKASLRLVSDFDVDTCPVCESEIDSKQLVESLGARLKASEELILAKNAVQTKTESLRQAVQRLLEDYRTFIEESGNLAARDEWTPYVHVSDILMGLKDTLRTEANTEMLDNTSKVLENLVSSHTKIVDAIDRLIRELGGTERWNAIRKLSTQLELCIIEGERLRKAPTTRLSLTRQHSVAKAIATHASNARKQAAAEILDGVSATANQFYETIHPGEKISTSRLDVRAATDASVRLVCTFADSVENPLLHLSESHLDTLGLCYFLAIRRKQADNNPDFKLMVLDDVMHSVDADHRRRVVELLKENFKDHQLIITTHDQVFYLILCQIFKHGEIKKHKFGSWSLERGPVLIDSNTDIDRLIIPEVRNRKSAEELAAAAGRFLEDFLRKLTEYLQINIQARFETRYTIGDLWPRLSEKLKKRRTFTDQHGELATRIDNSVWIRNEVGAHHNEDAAPPTEEEVREFVEMLSNLYYATYCSDCRNYIKRQDNGDWSCKCGSLTY